MCCRRNYFLQMQCFMVLVMMEMMLVLVVCVCRRGETCTAFKNLFGQVWNRQDCVSLRMFHNICVGVFFFWLSFFPFLWNRKQQ